SPGACALNVCSGFVCHHCVRLPDAHWPRQSHLSGLRLSYPGKRHLLVWHAAHEIDAARRRGWHSPRLDRGRIRHRDYCRPHSARVRHARHAKTYRAARVTELAIILVPLVTAILALVWASERTRPWLLL